MVYIHYDLLYICTTAIMDGSQFQSSVWATIFNLYVHIFYIMFVYRINTHLDPTPYL